MHAHALEQRELGRAASAQQLSRSSGVGLLAGGAQRTAAVTQQSVSRRPSSRATDVGWLARPARQSAANSQSPERSPVKMRPVRLPPWAAGARPEHDDPRRGVAETRHRPAPVVLIDEGAALDPGDLLAPGDQPRAAAAAGDLGLKLLERVSHLSAPRTWYLASVSCFCGRHQSALSPYQAIVAASPCSKSWNVGRQPSSSRSLIASIA